MVGSSGENRDSRVGGEKEDEREESNVDQAVVRAGYRSLMDDITTNEEELGDVSGECHTRLKEYMEANEELFHQVEYLSPSKYFFTSSYLVTFQVSAPQEAVLDARVLKQLSRLCRTQAEQMSANITQFNQQVSQKKIVMF